MAGKVYDKTTGMVRNDLTGKELQRRVLEGTAGLIPGESYDVVSADGERGTFTDAKSLVSALQGGQVRFEGREEGMKAEAEDQGLRTFAENTLSAFTMGASDALGRALATAGTTSPVAIQDTQKQFVDETNMRSTVNPGSAISGQIAGTLASALVPGGPLAQVGKGAKIAGSAVQAGRLGRLGGAVVREGLEGAAIGLGSAISEASLGDPDDFAEYFLADVGMATAFGGGLPILGKTLKAGGKGAMKILPSRAKDVISVYAKQAGALPAKGLERAYDGLRRRLVRLQAKATGADAKFLEKVSASTPEGKILRQKLLGSKKPDVEVVKRLTQLSDDVEQIVQQQSQKAVGTFKKNKVAQMLSKDSVDVATAARAADDVFARIEQQADDMLKDSSSFGWRSDVKRSRDLARNMRQTIKNTDDAAELYVQMDKAKRLLADNAKFNRNLAMMDSRDYAASSALRNLHGDLKANLESAELWGTVGKMQQDVNVAWKEMLDTNKVYRRHFMTNTPQGFVHDAGKLNSFVNQVTGVRGDAKMEALLRRRAAQQRLVKTLDDHYDFDEAGKEAIKRLAGTTDEAGKVIKEIEGNLTLHNKWEEVVKAEKESFFGRVGELSAVGGFLAGGPAAGAVAAAGTLLFKPATVLRTVASIERHAGNALKRMSSGVKRFAGTAAKTAELTYKPTATKALLELKGTSGERRRKAYESVLSEVRDLASNIDNVTSVLQARMGAISQDAPAISSKMTHRALTALQELSKELPPDSLSTDEAFGAKKVPTATSEQIDRFVQKLEGIEDPLSILDDMNNNMLTAEKVEAVKNVYPRLFEEMGVQIMEEISEAQASGNELPYQKRLQLGLVFEVPTDESLRPNFVRAMIDLSAQRKQQQGQKRGGFAPSRATPKPVSAQPEATVSEQIISRR